MMKPKLRTIGLLLVATVALLASSACNITLAPDGVYQGDQFLYTTDQTVKLQKAGFDTFLKWEMENRAVITNQWPQITVAADDIRAKAPGWFKMIGVARADYINVRLITHGLTNSPALDTARSNFVYQVNLNGGRVNSAQALVDGTTLAKKPQLNKTQ